ncbi:hypothetical protein SAMN04488591_2570 [Microbacterium azadirachtae]|uniref:DUF1643 domain-containing protein n=1 Tax=Microbacterium azadirachtae TaxID=582680 RepID=A0A1I6I9B7_9MICO|nr:DUF1643 domain-containing protein [Microbacterium azadirachtae]SFR62980.1 hypothetical protein SAMN04488591_2570 [Microbacterium azadirachtae]
MTTDAAIAQQQWIYERAADGSARFALGTLGENPLICFGINPSTAVPGVPDPTIKRLTRFAVDNGYDSWMMLNVYPQISTDPRGLDLEHRAELKFENERHIASLLEGRRTALLAAWGGLIETRAYLRALLQDIAQITSATGSGWLSLGEPTKHGHPRHPLYVKANVPLRPFDVDGYLRGLR